MKKKIVLVLNILIVAFTLFGLGVMIYRNGGEGGLLSSTGWENLKYFTVLSNILCGVVAGIFLIRKMNCSKGMLTLKLAAAAAVTVTFLVVACFFGPLYGYAMLYLGSNFWFHLIIPLLGMVEFCLLEGELPFQQTFLAGSPAVFYGCFYLGNILINGKGKWPDSNDWYGFMNWGFGPALIIFAVIILTNWGVACLLRWIQKIAFHRAL